MYNSEIKEKFVEEFSTCESRKHAAVVMFNTLEPYERKWGADFCSVSKEDLYPVLCELVGYRVSSQKTRLSILKLYVRWCIDNHIEGACDELFSIDDLGLDKLKRQMVANPQHLQRYLNCICDAESEETICCIYRCFYWLAYSGLNEDEVFSVVSSEVDLTDMVIRHDGNEYPIYREAIPSFKNCINLTQFRFKHPNYSPDKIVYKERAVGKMLLRGIVESKSIKAFRVEMSRRAANPKYKSIADITDKSLDLKLSFYRVWLSGLFYRTYEAERAGVPANFLDAAEQYMKRKTYKYYNGKQRQLANDYLEDYNRWKEAYSI